MPGAIHRTIDFLLVGAAFGLPRMRHWSRRSTHLLSVASCVLFVSNLLRRSDGGFVPVKAHLALDSALYSALFSAQFLLTEEESNVRGTVAGLALLGLISTAATALNASTAGKERERYG